MNEKEIVELIRTVKITYPNEFYELMGYMRGLKKSAEDMKHKNKDKEKI